MLLLLTLNKFADDGWLGLPIEEGTNELGLLLLLLLCEIYFDIELHIDAGVFGVGVGGLTQYKFSRFYLGIIVISFD